MQFAFDFGQREAQAVAKHPAKLTRAEEDARQQAIWERQREQARVEARAHWQIGMIASLPLFCEVEGSKQRYTQMLPGVVENINGDAANVRIYAAPEYGCWLEDYPIHLHLAVNVLLVDLGKYPMNLELQRIVDEGRLAAGDADLAATIRARAQTLKSA